jgi:hypothetical protein
MTKNKESAKRGRPELDDGEKKSVIVQFRVTESESKKLAEKASRAGKKSISDWLRETALAVS